MKDTIRISTLVSRIVWAMLTVACCIFIIGNSSADGVESGETSLRVTETVAEITVKDYETMPPAEQAKVVQGLHGYVREAAHGLEFALLGFLCMMFFLSWEEGSRPVLPGHWYRYLASLGFCVLFAVTDEVHQIFVSGRAFQMLDIGIDSVGATCGSAAALVVGCLFGALSARIGRHAES